MSERNHNEIKRTFPKTKAILLAIILAVQIGLVIFGFTFTPKPQDVIKQYDVTVSPQADGSLDIEYHLVWKALDENEPLTWVEIGMANSNFTVQHDSVSNNVRDYYKNNQDGHVTLRLDFNQPYFGGAVLDIRFTVNQRDMLCRNEQGYFYEFVPGWFNAIPVENYDFRWKMAGGDLRWQGSLDYGQYCIMSAQYDNLKFAGQRTVQYVPFRGSGAHSQPRIDTALPCCLIAAILILAEVYIIDSFVSYRRGRGFLTGHGHHIHTHGRTNPHYVRARAIHNATHHGGRSGGGRSGGCACACACACAGGGRAGCSQKDTFGVKATEE